MVNHPNRSRPLREINAELLAALKEAEEYVGVDMTKDEICNLLVTVRAAIAKAEGRS